MAAGVMQSLSGVLSQPSSDGKDMSHAHALPAFSALDEVLRYGAKLVRPPYMKSESTPLFADSCMAGAHGRSYCGTKHEGGRLCDAAEISAASWNAAGAKCAGRHAAAALSGRLRRAHSLHTGGLSTSCSPHLLTRNLAETLPGLQQSRTASVYCART